MLRQIYSPHSEAIRPSGRQSPHAAMQGFSNLARTFSSQAGSPSDSENATNQKLRAFDLIQSDRKTL